MVELEENVIYFLVGINSFEISACKNKKRRINVFFFFFEEAILSPKGSFSDEKNKTTTTKTKHCFTEKSWRYFA